MNIDDAKRLMIVKINGEESEVEILNNQIISNIEQESCRNKYLMGTKIEMSNVDI